jgi:hypothetical protein
MVYGYFIDGVPIGGTDRALMIISRRDETFARDTFRERAAIELRYCVKKSHDRLHY